MLFLGNIGNPINTKKTYIVILSDLNYYLIAANNMCHGGAAKEHRRHRRIAMLI